MTSRQKRKKATYRWPAKLCAEDEKFHRKLTLQEKAILLRRNFNREGSKGGSKGSKGLILYYRNGGRGGRISQRSRISDFRFCRGQWRAKCLFRWFSRRKYRRIVSLLSVIFATSVSQVAIYFPHAANVCFVGFLGFSPRAARQMEGNREVSRFLAPPPQAAAGSSANISFCCRTRNGNNCEKLGTYAL